MRLLLAVAMSALWGCGGDRTAGTFVPTSPSVVTNSTPSWIIRGMVFHTNYTVCRSCVVEIVDGPLAGTRTVTNGGGHFTLVVPDITSRIMLRAVKEGSASVEDKVVGRGTFSTWVSLYVTSVVPPTPMRGAYRLKLEADPITCVDIPAYARLREYEIVLDTDAFLPQYRLTAGPLGGSVERFDMRVGVSGDTVGVIFEHPADESAGIIERLNADTGEWISVLGWTPEPASYAVPLTSSFTGTVTWCETRGCFACESTRHQLTLTPR